MSLATTVDKLRQHTWFGVAEYYVRPWLKNRLQGVFNGQEVRQAIYQSLLRTAHPDAIVECGTYRGSTTEYLQETSGLIVDTVEVSPRFYGYARTRLAQNPRIRVHLSDSRSALRKLLTDPGMAGRRVLFYLDSHWRDDLPLREELEILFRSQVDPVVLVDDFCVPGDSGYGYDDYGLGKALNAEYLDTVASLGFRRFYPATKSEQETGFRRGCVVLAKGPAADALAEGCPLLWEDTAANAAAA